MKSSVRLAQIGLVAFALCLACATPSVEAAIVLGDQGFADLGPTTANNANLSLATSFTIGSWLNNNSNTLDFSTYTPAFTLLQFNVPLNLANITSFTFGNASFGTFTASSYVVTTSTATNVSFLIYGTFDPGTNFPGTKQDLTPTSLNIGDAVFAASWACRSGAGEHDVGGVGSAGLGLRRLPPSSATANRYLICSLGGIGRVCI
jgi:hypothetical protein